MKRNDIKHYRETRLKKQRSICPLCGRYIKKEDAALDHDHSDGRVRQVLHKNCNSIEGRVLHWVKRVGIRPDTFIRKLAEYWDDDYSSNPVHPTHKTDLDKRISQLRRRIKRAKQERTKQRLRDEIKRLQKEGL